MTLSIPSAAARCVRSTLWRIQFLSHTRPSRKQSAAPPQKRLDVSALLSSPSWDPSTLLPTAADISSPSSRLSSSKLRHLLRLSSLPPPKDAEEEKAMLDTLAAQLHFVRQIKAVDTKGVEPLRRIEDETVVGLGEEDEREIEKALEGEELRGRYWPRPRRRKDIAKEDDDRGKAKEDGSWDLFGNAKRRVGRYFVVERVKR